LNALPLPVRPKDRSDKGNVLLLYLVDFSTHQVCWIKFTFISDKTITRLHLAWYFCVPKNFRRIFFFKFKSVEAKEEFLEISKPLYEEIIGGGNVSAEADCDAETEDEDSINGDDRDVDGNHNNNNENECTTHDDIGGYDKKKGINCDDHDFGDDDDDDN